MFGYIVVCEGRIPKHMHQKNSPQFVTWESASGRRPDEGPLLRPLMGAVQCSGLMRITRSLQPGRPRPDLVAPSGYGYSAAAGSFALMFDRCT